MQYTLGQVTVYLDATGKEREKTVAAGTDILGESCRGATRVKENVGE